MSQVCSVVCDVGHDLHWGWAAGVTQHGAAELPTIGDPHVGRQRPAADADVCHAEARPGRRSADDVRQWRGVQTRYRSVTSSAVSTRVSPAHLSSNAHDRDSTGIDAGLRFVHGLRIFAPACSVRCRPKASCGLTHVPTSRWRGIRLNYVNQHTLPSPHWCVNRTRRTSAAGVAATYPWAPPSAMSRTERAPRPGIILRTPVQANSVLFGDFWVPPPGPPLPRQGIIPVK